MGIHVSAHHQLCCLTSLPDPRLSSLPLSGPSDLYKLKSHCTLILVQINAPTVSLRFQGIQSAPSHPSPPFLPDSAGVGPLPSTTSALYTTPSPRCLSHNDCILSLCPSGSLCHVMILCLRVSFLVFSKA